MQIWGLYDVCTDGCEVFLLIGRHYKPLSLKHAILYPLIITYSCGPSLNTFGCKGIERHNIDVNKSHVEVCYQSRTSLCLHYLHLEISIGRRFCNL